MGLAVVFREPRTTASAYTWDHVLLISFEEISAAVSRFLNRSAALPQPSPSSCCLCFALLGAAPVDHLALRTSFQH